MPAVLDPPRTQQQKLSALARANEIRSARSHLKRDLKTGKKRVEVLILNPPEWAATMPVSKLLMATPMRGRVKVETLLRRLQLSPSKTLGGMTRRQRVALAEAL